MTARLSTLNIEPSPLEAVVAVTVSVPVVAAWLDDVRGDTGNGHARISETLLPLLLAAASAGPADKDGSLDPVQARPLLVVVADDAEAERV
ncbi:MAG: hypothetical protein ABI200_04890, partial [Gaiellales bacterium]